MRGKPRRKFVSIPLGWYQGPCGHSICSWYFDTNVIPQYMHALPMKSVDSGLEGESLEAGVARLRFIRSVAS